MFFMNKKYKTLLLPTLTIICSMFTVQQVQAEAKCWPRALTEYGCRHATEKECTTLYRFSDNRKKRILCSWDSTQKKCDEGKEKFSIPSTPPNCAQYKTTETCFKDVMCTWSDEAPRAKIMYTKN